MKKIDVVEALLPYLTEHQQCYAGSKAYFALCEALAKYLESKRHNWREKLQVLEHAKVIFDDLCEKTPAPPKKQEKWQEAIEWMMQ